MPNTDLKELQDDYDPLDDFYKGGTISIQQILNNLIQLDNNLNLKTRVNSPSLLASWDMLSVLAKSVELEESSKLMDFFSLMLKQYRVSSGGESRKEIVEALKSLMEKRTTKLSLSQSLMESWD